MCETLNKYKEARIKHDEKVILDFLSNTGIPRDSIKDEELDFIDGKVTEFDLDLAKKKQVDTTQAYYYYKGAFDSKTRPFCKKILELNKYWGETDLLILSERLGYSVFLFQGGFNCRHDWQKARLKKADLESGKIVPDQPKLNQIYSSAKYQQKGLGKYFPLA